MRVAMLIALIALMKALGQLGLASANDPGHHAAMAFGFLILSGFVFGEWARRLKMPAITGYLLAGLFCGPGLLGLLSVDVVLKLKMFDQLALFLIALEAGAELHVDSLKRQLRLILYSSLFQVIMGWLLMVAAFWVIRPWVPFLDSLDPTQAIALLALIAMISVAKSPSTTVAVIVETGAKGPLRDYALGVTVLMDVLIILLFTLTLQVCLPTLGIADSDSHLLEEVLRMIASIIIGIACGGLLILWMRRYEKHLHLVLLAFCILMVRISQDFHLESLLVAVGSGFMIANYSNNGHRFVQALEKISLPIYLVFFGITGASLDLGLMVNIWPLALFYALFRCCGKWISNYSAARICKAEAAILNHGWKGFLGQAGVSLGFAAIIAESFPGPGTMVKEMIVAGVLINQLVGPVLFKHGLEKAGEIPESRSDKL